MKVILTTSAENNIVQIREFYRDIPKVGKRAIEAVKGGLFRLVDYPNIGKPNPEDDGVTRLLPIGFGGSGYLVKYRYLEIESIIVVLGIRAFKQAGFYE